MLEYSDIRQGKIIIHEGEPCEVMDNHVARTQQRKPQNQVKLKSLLSGRTWNTVFHAADKAEEAEISKRDIKFLYGNRGEFWFCDPNNPKDRFKIEEKIIGEGAKIGKNVKISSGCIIGDHAKVKDDLEISGKICPGKEVAENVLKPKIHC